MGEWYRQDKDLIQKSGCRANILLKSNWKMLGMEEDLDFCHALWEMTERMQKTFSHPTTQPALRCSTQGWLFNSTKNQRRLVCWTSMISSKRWKVMIRDAVSCTFALFLHFHNAVRFPSQCTQRSIRCTLDRWSSPRRSSCGRQWTWRQPASAFVITAMIHHDPWPKCCEWCLQKSMKPHTPVFCGFVKHLDTSRIRNGSSSVPDWSIFLLRAEVFLAGQRVDGGTLSSPIPS